jgi:hypothetical protein
MMPWADSTACSILPKHRQTRGLPNVYQNGAVQEIRQIDSNGASVPIRTITAVDAQGHVLQETLGNGSPPTAVMMPCKARSRHQHSASDHRRRQHHAELRLQRAGKSDQS